MTSERTRPQQVNRFKQKTKAGDRAIAMWVSISWPPIVEILGDAACDAAIIDMEHGLFSHRDVEVLCTSCIAGGITPLFRPAGLDKYGVSRALDAGAQGIIYADIKDKAEAELAVAYTKYPPVGTRGWAGSHNHFAVWLGHVEWGREESGGGAPQDVRSPEFVKAVNNEVWVALMIESPEAVENIEAILEVPGIDSIRFGWGDYSANVGFDRKRCEEASVRVYEACRARGIGYSFTPGEVGVKEHYPGCWYIIGYDGTVISAALRKTVAAARAAYDAR
jgi:2-keto-3-deoxy-L-rhamnonate aldolase RhmA